MHHRGRPFLVTDAQSFARDGESLVSVRMVLVLVPHDIRRHVLIHTAGSGLCPVPGWSLIYGFVCSKLSLKNHQW